MIQCSNKQMAQILSWLNVKSINTINDSTMRLETLQCFTWKINSAESEESLAMLSGQLIQPTNKCDQMPN